MPPPTSRVESTAMLSLMRGDLITLEKEVGITQAAAESAGERANVWRRGRNARSGMVGEFSLDYVYILPSLTEPPPEILVRLRAFCDFWGLNLEILSL